MSQGAGRLGSPLIRNRATVGGNLVTARPASDLAPPLLVLGASVILKGPKGERTLPLENFILGPGQTAIQPEEILSRIFIPHVEGPSSGAYIKLGSRKTLEISLVNVASFLSLGPDGSIKRPGWPWGPWARLPSSLRRRPRSFWVSNPKMKKTRSLKKPPGRRPRMPSPLPTIADQRNTAGKWSRF